jgi:hypothetical protein
VFLEKQRKKEDCGGHFSLLIVARVVFEEKSRTRKCVNKSELPSDKIIKKLSWPGIGCAG